MREQYDIIRDSFINGQITQGVRQMSELSGPDRAGLLHYLADELNHPEMAIKAAAEYFRRTK